MTAKSDLQHEHTDSSPTEGRTESLSPGKHANVPVQDATGAWQAEPIASAGDTLLTVDVPASVREETSGATIDAPAGRAAPMAEDTFGATIDAPASRPPSSGETPFGATTDIPADCAPPAVADTFGATIDAPAERPFPSPDTFGATVDAPATRTGSPRPAEEPPPAGSGQPAVR